MMWYGLKTRRCLILVPSFGRLKCLTFRYCHCRFVLATEQHLYSSILSNLYVPNVDKQPSCCAKICWVHPSCPAATPGGFQAKRSQLSNKHRWLANGHWHNIHMYTSMCIFLYTMYNYLQYMYIYIVLYCCCCCRRRRRCCCCCRCCWYYS